MQMKTSHGHEQHICVDVCLSENEISFLISCSDMSEIHSLFYCNLKIGNFVFYFIYYDVIVGSVIILVNDFEFDFVKK